MLNGLFLASAVQQMSATNKAQLASELASSMSQEARRESVLLRADVEKLFMIVEALWTLLKKQGGHTDEALAELIRQIDMKDGRLDGKVAKTVRPDCPKCGRKLIGNHPVCLYCGAEVMTSPFQR